MKNWTGAFQIAAVYVGTVIGAGFATGREIVEFFTRFGFYGLVAILVAGYLFIFIGSKIMLKAIQIKAESYEEYNRFIFGPHVAKAMNILMLVMLIGVCAVMLSGAEALFAEQLGFGRMTGTLLTVILALAVMAIGVKGLFAVNSFVVPVMIAFNVFVMVKAMPAEGFLSMAVSSPGMGESWKAGISAFSYAALNLALAQAVLVPMAKEVNDRTMVKWGGILGGLLLTVILMTSHLALATLPSPTAFDIPMAVVVKHSAGSIYAVYLCIIYGEIFTSVIGNLFGLERQIRRYIPVHSLWIHASILLLVFAISQVNYGTLLGVLYPLFGYISLVFLAVVIWKREAVK
ncbi:MAG TPA: hypothetical protein VIG80_03810 [Bacillaceae bacterium]